MDDFMKQYQSLKDLSPQIRQQINLKKNTARESISYNKTTTRLKTLLNTFESDLKQLKNELQRLTNTKRYPQIELDRRQELVNEINTLFHQFQQEIESNSSAYQFGSNQNRYYDDESVDNSKYTVDEARERQMLLLQEQDEGLDMLGEILSKQKFIARDMCQEITVQNEILDDINDIMDQADVRLVRNIRNTEKVSRKSDTCGLWVLIVLLFVADIVIILI